MVCLSLFAISCHIPAAVDLSQRSAATPDAAQEADATPRSPAFEARVAEVVAYFERKSSGLSTAEIRDVAVTIVEQAFENGLDPRLVMAVIHIESRANTYAVSPVGAIGLMQIMPMTGEELAHEMSMPWAGEASLFDPKVNVRMGVAYLRQLADRYGNTSVALAAYNWGPGRIDSKLRRGVPLPREYVDSVMEAYYGQPTALRVETASRTVAPSA
jgi:soluble lytic murein transglycosylase-like protein